MDSTFKTLLKLVRENVFLLSLVASVLCSFAYLYQVFILYKWGIPLGMVDGINIQYLMIVVVGILYCLSSVYLQEYIRVRFSYYASSYTANRFIQKYLKKVIKRSRGEKKQSSRDKLIETKQKCNKLMISLAKSIVGVIAMASLCFFPFFAVYYIVVLNTDIWRILILYAIAILIAVVFEYYLNSRPIKKEIHETKIQIKKDNSSIDSYLYACQRISKAESSRLKVKIANSQETDIIYHPALLITATILFVICTVLNICSPPQKDYWVYSSEENGVFVSVFESGGYSFLKRASIEDGTVTIYLGDQMYIETAGKTLKHYEFKEVIINNNSAP